MGSMSSGDPWWNHWLEEVGRSRGLLFGVACGCIVLGVLAVLLPTTLFGSLAALAGLLLILSGAIKATQLVTQGRGEGRHWRAWAVILAQVAIDWAAGVVLLNHRNITVDVVIFVLGLMFLVEGAVYVEMGRRAATARGRALLWASALLMGGLGLAIALRLIPDPIAWVGYVVGLKLVLFGIALIGVAASVPAGEADQVYMEEVLEPIAGELYAVYFGTAFHLGVYLGDGEVVHYQDDNLVHKVTWPEFLKDRIPQHWTYPDLPSKPVEVVRQTALSEVGKTYPYSLLKFNCENFAIYCKSGGETRNSKFAQVPASLASVRIHPWVGMVAELNTRFFEWLAFHWGGASGKRLSLSIRRVGAMVTTGLLATQMKRQEKKT